MNLSSPGRFLVVRLLITASVSNLMLIFLGIQLLSALDMGGCMCPGIYPFLLDFPVYCIVVFIVFSDGNLYFYGIGGEMAYIILFASI